MRTEELDSRLSPNSRRGATDSMAITSNLGRVDIAALLF